jgi:hypothetical protein
VGEEAVDRSTMDETLWIEAAEAEGEATMIVSLIAAFMLWHKPGGKSHPQRRHGFRKTKGVAKKGGLRIKGGRRRLGF